MSDHLKVWWRLGFGTGFAAAVVLISGAMAMGLDSSEKAIGDFLFKWQTLIAGVLALIGAWLTIQSVERQIAQQKLQSDEALRRRHFSARAAMPSALSQITQYARASLNLLKGISPVPVGDVRILHTAPWTPPPLPSIPKEALTTLQTCIETAPSNAMSAIAQVLEDFQILHSRLESLTAEVAPGSTTSVAGINLIDQIVETLEFDVRTSNLFDYARRRSEVADVPITREAMGTRAFFAGVYEADYPGLDVMIERRFERAD